MKDIVRESTKDGAIIFRMPQTKIPDHLDLVARSLPDYTSSRLQGFNELFDLMADEDREAYGSILKAIVSHLQESFDHLDKWLLSTIGDVAFYQPEAYCGRIEAVRIYPAKEVTP